MSGNSCNNLASLTPTSRLERLMKVREQRKSKTFPLGEETRDSNGEDEQSNRDSWLTDGDHWGLMSEEFLEQALNSMQDGNDGSPTKQRLLVVANRLPVSAVRMENNTWHLEVSVGGLVTALLGNCYLYM